MQPNQSAQIRDVGESQFDVEVVQASRIRPVVVDFWAAWCGPCHQLSPILERVAARYAEDVELVKVDVDAAAQTAQRFGVRGIPAVKAFQDGVVVSEFTGVQPEAAVDRFFAALVPNEADRLVARAAVTARDERERLLRAALESDPAHTGALVALAEVHAERGEDEEARGLLAKAPPTDQGARKVLARLNLGSRTPDGDLEGLRRAASSGDAGAQLDLGVAMAGMGRYGEALPILVSAARQPATREAARERVLDVFSLLGDDHDLVRTWRPKLAAALF